MQQPCLFYLDVIFYCWIYDPESDRKAQDYPISHTPPNMSVSTCELWQIDFLTFIKSLWIFILKETSLEYIPAFWHCGKSNYLASCQVLSRGTQHDEPKHALSCHGSDLTPVAECMVAPLPQELTGSLSPRAAGLASWTETTLARAGSLVCCCWLSIVCSWIMNCVQFMLSLTWGSSLCCFMSHWAAAVLFKRFLSLSSI